MSPSLNLQMVSGSGNASWPMGGISARGQNCARLLLCFEKNYYILIWCVSMCACGGQKQLLRVYSSSYRSWELNLGHRSWSPAEPSHSPFVFSHVSLTTVDSYLMDFGCNHPRYHLLSPFPLTLSPFSTGPSSTPESSFPFATHGVIDFN